MSYSDSFESICTVLTRASEEYEDFFAKEELLTEVLSDDALHNIIRPNSERLRVADGRYRLDDLLYAMLKHVPHPLGQRYVAICLHIAHQKGKDGVVNAAKAWLDNLLLPSPLVYLFPLRLRTTSASVFALSRYKKTWPASSQTPTIVTTMEQVDSVTPDDQSILGNAVIILPLPPLFCLLHQLQVAVREEYRCAITKIFDSARAEKLLQEERIGEIPKRVGQHAMEATHIIPFLLNGLYGRAIADLQIVHNVLSFSHFTHLCNRRTLLGLWICFGPGRELT